MIKQIDVTGIIVDDPGTSLIIKVDAGHVFDDEICTEIEIVDLNVMEGELGVGEGVTFTSCQVDSILGGEVCEGASQFLTWTGTEFRESDENIYARPAQLGNFANEGFASYTAEGKCIDGVQSIYTNYLWADDSVNGGTSLRSGQVVADTNECTTDGDQPQDDKNNHSNNGSSDFFAGSAAGAFTAGLFGIVGVLTMIGGVLQQVLATFPALQQYLRF